MTRNEKLENFKRIGYTYDQTTGDIRRPDSNIVRSLNKEGYIWLHTSINSKAFSLRGHQFAWYMVNGIWDKDLQIDHCDGVKNNNKITNLRLVTIQQNQFNTNHKGYSWSSKSNKWKSTIGINGKLIHLGYFVQEQDARNAYVEAKKKYHKI